MTKTFNLSEKIVNIHENIGYEGDMKVKDVKEFIKLRNLLGWQLYTKQITWSDFIKKRNKLAGESLK